MRHPPYRFVTPARIPIDLRLHNSVLLDRCLAIIHGLRQPALSGWFQDFKEHAISRFRGICSWLRLMVLSLCCLGFWPIVLCSLIMIQAICFEHIHYTVVFVELR